MSLTFDTLGYAKHLRDAGIDRDHAEAHASAAREFIMLELVTKADLKIALLAHTVTLGGMIAAATAIIIRFH